MPQTTFADISKVSILESLSDKQLRIVRLLREGHTQGTISKRMNISRASVSQTCKRLEENNLIKKEVGTRYNILYSVSIDLQKRIGGVQEVVSPVRTHNIALKFAILKQDRPFTRDKRTGWQKSWKMRGWEASAFWYDGKAGEITCTVTTNPKSIVIRMDAGQKIIAKDHFDAESKGYQHLIYVRQQFIDSQRRFGIDIEIEPTGQRITKAHGGLAFHEGGPLDSETRIPGTWVDTSAKKELGPGYKEFEMHTDHSLLTPLEAGVFAVAGMPDMIRSCIDPLSQNIQRVEALIQGGTTSEQKVNQLMGVIGSLLERLLVLEKKLESKG